MPAHLGGVPLALTTFAGPLGNAGVLPRCRFPGRSWRRGPAQAGAGVFGVLELAVDTGFEDPL
ncbi:hypothetical protein [Streptomyces lydicus]|uniref:hypothetical protein n=1 Tax=Streptomyces lydicus TaxID=47763 RepID=UPI0036E334BC